MVRALSPPHALSASRCLGPSVYIYPARPSNAFSIFFGLGRGFWSFLSDLCYACAALPLFTESELAIELGEVHFS